MEQTEHLSWGWQADYWEKMNEIAEIKKKYWDLKLQKLKDGGVTMLDTDKPML